MQLNLFKTIFKKNIKQIDVSTNINIDNKKIEIKNIVIKHIKVKQ